MLSEKKANYFMIGGGLIIFIVFAIIMVFMTVGHNKRKNYEDLHDRYMEIKNKTDYGKNCQSCCFPFTFNSSSHHDCIQMPDSSKFWCPKHNSKSGEYSLSELVQCPKAKCAGFLCSKLVTVSDKHCEKLKHPEICGEYTLFVVNRLLGKPMYKNNNDPNIILRASHHFWLIENLNRDQSFAISMNSGPCPYSVQNPWHVYVENEWAVDGQLRVKQKQVQKSKNK